MRVQAEEQQAALDEREREWNQSVQKREAERAAEWERKLEALWRSFEQRAEEKLRELSARATLGSKLARAPQPKKEAAHVAASLRNEAQREAKEDLRTSLLEHWSGGESAPSSGPPGREPQVGEIVRLKSFGRQGIVRGRSGNWLEVEVGHLRTKVPLDDVAEIIAVAESGKPPAPKFSIRVERVPEGVKEGSSSEINVIGETAEEALRRVDKFLDNAFLSQIERVRIVHGSGKGILRKALAELFTDHPHVEKFFPAPQDEGGGGATIVELKI